MSKVLIVEDDNQIATLESDYLSMNDINSVIINDGNSVLNTIKKDSFDLIILDIMLPNSDGIELCKIIKEEYDLPVIMVSAKMGQIEKLKSLGYGANDYITKPFDPAELVARVKSQITNYKRLKSTEEIINIKNIKINSKNYQVYKDDIEIKLPNKEFELLNYLAQNPNIVFSKEQLFEAIWGLDSDGYDATVTVHVNRIREKIEKDPNKPEIIETVWGAGYRLNK